DAKARDRTGRWTRWPFLLVFSLLIAIISGLAGGFIGKAMQTTSNKTGAANIANPNSSPAETSCAPPPPPENTTETLSPSPQQNTTTLLAIPTTGCPTSNNQTLFSTITTVSYTLHCAIDWTGSDLVAALTPTLSSCIEACHTVNQYNATDGKLCVGASFVPSWVNASLALLESARPSNCFLKYKADAGGWAANKRGVEVVAICLEGRCPKGWG
ncbi:uncharacterized protein BDR25DRAFT_376418, partial [Lindgomyces ingoldianus]